MKSLFSALTAVLLALPVLAAPGQPYTELSRGNAILSGVNAQSIAERAIPGSKIEAIHDNPTARSTTNLDARTGAILLEVGPDGVNVGSIPRNVLYDNVYKALQAICPFGEAHQCTGKTASFRVTQEFMGAPDVLNGEVIVDVSKAWWGTKGDVYYLMIGAIAGIFERGCDSPHNCRVIDSDREAELVHCNAPKYAAIHFPGGYHMQVHFKNEPSRSFKGKYDCNSMINSATNYIDTLQDQIETALNDGDLYVTGRCMP